MSRINVPSEVTALALALANIGRDAERTCNGYATRQSLERLHAELGKGKGAIMKLRRAVRDMAAAEAARERDEARKAAIFERDKERLLAERERRVSGERMAAGLGIAA